jgi:NADPH:quinone reductase-like Zn-dependent oxidoreductase
LIFSQIGELPHAEAASFSNIYAVASALFLHLNLDRPSTTPNPNNKMKKILIWGASSSFGAYATQLTANSGYAVIGVTSSRHIGFVRSFGAEHIVDKESETAVEEIIALGPFDAVLAAADSAADQVVLGSVLAAQGGGKWDYRSFSFSRIITLNFLYLEYITRASLIYLPFRLVSVNNGCT